jgi:hypothetical protein
MMELHIPTPGLFLNVPAEDYHSWFAASNSLLKILIDKTPGHVLRSFQQPKAQTKAMQFGELLHSILLLPEEFGDQVGVMPEGLDRRTKEGKAAFAELSEVYPEEKIVSWDLFEKVKAARERIFENALCRKVFETLNLIETSFVWKDLASAALCKARIDAISERGFVVDIKTTVSASPSDFAASCYKFGYHTQAAHYKRACKDAEIEANHHLIIAIEKETNFVAVYELDQQAIEAGENELDRVLPVWKRCLENNSWPAYSTEIRQLSLPKWAINDMKYREDQ